MSRGFCLKQKQFIAHGSQLIAKRQGGEGLRAFGFGSLEFREEKPATER
jgi:hypothetical protein